MATNIKDIIETIRQQKNIEKMLQAKKAHLLKLKNNTGVKIHSFLAFNENPISYTKEISECEAAIQNIARRIELLLSLQGLVKTKKETAVTERALTDKQTKLSAQEIENEKAIYCKLNELSELGIKEITSHNIINILSEKKLCLADLTTRKSTLLIKRNNVSSRIGVYRTFKEFSRIKNRIVLCDKEMQKVGRQIELLSELKKLFLEKNEKNVNNSNVSGLLILHNAQDDKIEKQINVILKELQERGLAGIGVEDRLKQCIRGLLENEIKELTDDNLQQLISKQAHKIVHQEDLVVLNELKTLQMLYRKARSGSFDVDKKLPLNIIKGVFLQEITEDLSKINNEALTEKVRTELPDEFTASKLKLKASQLSIRSNSQNDEKCAKEFSVLAAIVDQANKGELPVPLPDQYLNSHFTATDFFKSTILPKLKEVNHSAKPENYMIEIINKIDKSPTDFCSQIFRLLAELKMREGFPKNSLLVQELYVLEILTEQAEKGSLVDIDKAKNCFFILEGESLQKVVNLLNKKNKEPAQLFLTTIIDDLSKNPQYLTSHYFDLIAQVKKEQEGFTEQNILIQQLSKLSVLATKANSGNLITEEDFAGLTLEENDLQIMRDLLIVQSQKSCSQQIENAVAGQSAISVLCRDIEEEPRLAMTM